MQPFLHGCSMLPSWSAKTGIPILEWRGTRSTKPNFLYRSTFGMNRRGHAISPGNRKEGPMNPKQSGRRQFLKNSAALAGLAASAIRSEEHTSELQSLRHLV